MMNISTKLAMLACIGFAAQVMATDNSEPLTGPAVLTIDKRHLYEKNSHKVLNMRQDASFCSALLHGSVTWDDKLVTFPDWKVSSQMHTVDRDSIVDMQSSVAEMMNCKETRKKFCDAIATKEDLELIGVWYFFRTKVDPMLNTQTDRSSTDEYTGSVREFYKGLRIADTQDRDESLEKAAARVKAIAKPSELQAGLAEMLKSIDSKPDAAESKSDGTSSGSSAGSAAGAGATS